MSSKDKPLDDFKNAVKGINPLKDSNKISHPAPKKIKLVKAAPVIQEEEKIVKSSDVLFHKKRILSQAMKSHLVRGKYPIEDTIDLHGMTADPALKLLQEFISESFAANYFVVLVIHGKGRKTPDKPVLKNKVNHYLKQDPRVVAFCSAQQKDGGTGALYVMLDMNY